MNRRGKINTVVAKYGFLPFVERFGSALKNIHLNSLYLPESEITKGDQSFEELKLVVDSFERKHPDRARSTHDVLDRLFVESPILRNVTDIERTKYNLLFEQYGRGFSPEEIILYDLLDAEIERKRRFLSARETASITIRLNNLRDVDIFNNKGRTYEVFNKYYSREAIYILLPEDKYKFYDFVEKHPVFVKKAVYEAMGRSIELVDLNKSKIDPGKYFEELIKLGPHIVEERVLQSQSMSNLNPSSVNTVRSIVFNTKNGIKDLYYFMKVGRAGSFVDNGGQGGILIGINGDTGTLVTDGFDEMGNVYQCHPDSNISFKGYQLPDWESIKTLCREMTIIIPKVKFIGWDLAHTDKGWVLIEGNGNSQLIGPQTVFKRGIKEEVERVMREI